VFVSVDKTLVLMVQEIKGSQMCLLMYNLLIIICHSKVYRVCIELQL